MSRSITEQLQGCSVVTSMAKALTLLHILKFIVQLSDKAAIPQCSSFPINTSKHYKVDMGSVTVVSQAYLINEIQH